MKIALPEWPLAIFVLLLAACLVQLIYYVFIYRKLSRAESVTDPGREQSVSVIIAARNEAENLRKYLPQIMEQDYPDFEVIVVNDASYDDTGDLLRQMKQQYPRLHVVEIADHERFRHGKKFALTLGIKAAANEILLFCDADCWPRSSSWIRHMQAPYAAEGTEIVLGASPYARRKGLLNAFIRYETFLTALNYLSFAVSGIPYMGVGRNLSYRKSLFFKKKGFASHLHLRSGDDDLFVNQAATPQNTRIAWVPEAQTLSEAERSWADYFRQKRRHQSVGRYYKSRHKFLLSLPVLSGILFYLCLAVLAILGWNWPWLVAAAGLKYLVQYLVFRPVMKKTNAGDVWFFLPFFDLGYHIYIVILQLFPVSPEKVQWK